MAWSTSVIAPPDGSMRDYLASLEKVARRSEAIYWPGHGGPVRDPQRYVRALISHRRQREAAILARLEAGEASVAEIVARVYPGLAPALVGAASLSTLAHLEDLTERGLASSDGGSRSKRGFAAPDASRSRLLQRVLHRGGEAVEVTRVGAEIVPADARHRAQVDARLRGERPHAHRDVVGEAEHRRAGDRLDLRDAVDAQVRRIGIDDLPAEVLRHAQSTSW